MSDTDWMSDAVCTEYDPDTWFPTPGDNISVQKVKEICAGCPVRLECLAYAIDNGFDEGVFGGMTPKQRNRHRARGAA
jgi:WhiB family redox-sensing transcriptional regulator